MTLISKENLLAKLEQQPPDQFYNVASIRNFIKAEEDEKGVARTWNIIGEIVRCKDCKHRDAETGFCKGRGWPMQLVHEDGFCDKGERSEE